MYQVIRNVIVTFFILFESIFLVFPNQGISIYGEDEISIINQLYILEDINSQLTIDDVIKLDDSEFNKNLQSSLNYGYSLSSYWIHFSLENSLKYPLDYVLNISNPDLDIVEFYELIDGRIDRTIETGEVKKLIARDISHRNFLFNINLDPNLTYHFYLKINNIGDACYIPLKLQERNYSTIEDSKENTLKWLVYGVLIFIVLFNFYLFKSLKEKLNLYYSLFILFGTMLQFVIDGYHIYLDIPEVTNRAKAMVISLFAFFLLKFSELFIETRNKKFYLKKVFHYLRYTAIICGVFYFFKIPILNIPISVFSIVGSSIVLVFAFTAIIITSIVTLDKNYSPSVYFLLGFISALLGVVLFQLKEFGILPSILFFENSVRIGLTVESVFLTMAILERFRIQQDEAKTAIEASRSHIELQNKELEIINSELEKLSIVASETDNSVAIYDKSGRIEWCNEGFERFYETNVSKLIQEKTETIEEIIPYKEVKEMFQNCLTNKEPATFEAQLNFADGNKKWMQTTLSPYTKGNKVIAVDSDITSLKKYEESLEKAKEKAELSDKLKTIFLSNMSHEVRTPLNGIIGFSELLINPRINPDDREKFVEIIKGNGEQLIRIIDDILDMSLIETDQLKIWNSEFSLTQLCDELVDFFEYFKTSIGKSEIKLVKEFNIDSNFDSIKSDSARLKQVLMNILKNGFKFTDKGQVKFGCTTNENNILFYVEDTGIGIESDKIDDIFERFRQADERSTRKYGGNGLGLSISKGIIEKLGGEIWIDPEYTIGFRICFIIPLDVSEQVIEAAAKIQENDEHKQRIQNKHILIVEDNDVSYKYLEGILKPYTNTLKRAINGVEAVEKIKDNNFDLVLMDINLPELDGMAATREVRKFNKDIPIIAQTAYALSSEIDSIIESGCNSVISKPINSKLLFEKMGSAL